ncbi:MAG: LysR family transcriptional regulator [Candidatus Dormibacteraeota bacterium]|nr:LysR family transcriptional regulator [Candidatus Dormibacteraeota bacterium]MBO0760884.1 LysR family transcriptional regulator [Candidatus Dormibacteraeota bacterium]
MAGVNLRRFDLNLLVALDALLRYRNVTRAGEHIGLTQSAMSAELRRLRQMFDDELLVRVGREYHLTTLARDLVRPVGDVVAKIEDTIVHRPTFDARTESRRFSIVMSDYAMLLLLHPLLRRAEVEAPGVTVEVHPFKDQISRMLEPGGFDLVVGPEYELEGTCSQGLFSDRFVCVVSADHPDVAGCMTLELFESLPHLTIAWQSTLRSIADVHVESAGVHRRVELTTESFALAPFLVSGTRLVALVPSRLATRFGDLAGTRMVDPPFPPPVLKETMYWSVRADSDPAHAWLRDMIGEVACSLNTPIESDLRCDPVPQHADRR